MLKLVEKNARNETRDEITGEWHPASEIQFHYGPVTRLWCWICTRAAAIVKGERDAKKY